MRLLLSIKKSDEIKFDKLLFLLCGDDYKKYNFRNSYGYDTSSRTYNVPLLEYEIKLTPKVLERINDIKKFEW